MVPFWACHKGITALFLSLHFYDWDQKDYRLRFENYQFGSLKKCFFLNKIHFKLGHTLGRYIHHITPSDNQVLFILYILMFKFLTISFTYSAIYIGFLFMAGHCCR